MAGSKFYSDELHGVNLHLPGSARITVAQGAPVDGKGTPFELWYDHTPDTGGKLYVMTEDYWWKVICTGGDTWFEIEHGEGAFSSALEGEAEGHLYCLGEGEFSAALEGEAEGTLRKFGEGEFSTALEGEAEGTLRKFGEGEFSTALEGKAEGLTV